MKLNNPIKEESSGLAVVCTLYHCVGSPMIPRSSSGGDVIPGCEDPVTVTWVATGIAISSEANEVTARSATTIRARQLVECMVSYLEKDKFGSGYGKL